jgi:hypothetical protein
VGSRTGPVEEVVTHDVTGRLVDFFDVPALADEVVTVLQDRQKFTNLGIAGRAFMQQRYDLASYCLPGQLAIINA